MIFLGIKRAMQPKQLDGVLVVRCRRCPAHVQESLGSSLSATHTETILCHQCGADNSVRPPLGWRLAYGLKRARKRRRVFGPLWWAKTPWECWMMPYELKRKLEAKSRTP